MTSGQQPPTDTLHPVSQHRVDNPGPHLAGAVPAAERAHKSDPGKEVEVTPEPDVYAISWSDFRKQVADLQAIRRQVDALETELAQEQTRAENHREEELSSFKAMGYEGDALEKILFKRTNEVKKEYNKRAREMKLQEEAFLREVRGSDNYRNMFQLLYYIHFGVRIRFSGS